MTSELQHVIHSIENSNLRHTPYEHCLIENIFSEDFYEQIINNLPDDDRYMMTTYGFHKLDKEAQKTAKAYRYKFSLKKPESTQIRKVDNPDGHPLRELSKILISKEVYNAFSNLFSNLSKSDDMGVNAYLFRDKAGYNIPPHPDSSYKEMTWITYLARDDLHKEVGTVINARYDPKVWEGDQEQFIRYEQLEYKRNSGFAFPITKESFHSVDTITLKNFSRNIISNFYATDSFTAPLI